MDYKSATAYPQASAPPLYVDARVVEPFQIAVEAEDVYALETDNLVNKPRGRGTNVIRQAGKVESRETARKVAESRGDGHKILHTEHTMVVHSEDKAIVESTQANMKVRSSNADYVHELGASLPIASYAPNTGYTFSTPNPIEDKVRALEEATNPKPKGYQPMEYTSMYESEGGYKYEDYKSMYD